MSEEKPLSTDDWINKLAATNANKKTCSDYERAKAELTKIHVADVIAAMNKLNSSIVVSSASSQNLAGKVYWLNVILVAATSVGAIAAVATLFNC